MYTICSALAHKTACCWTALTWTYYFFKHFFENYAFLKGLKCCSIFTYLFYNIISAQCQHSLQAYPINIWQYDISRLCSRHSSSLPTHNLINVHLSWWSSANADMAMENVWSLNSKFDATCKKLEHNNSQSLFLCGRRELTRWCVSWTFIWSYIGCTLSEHPAHNPKLMNHFVNWSYLLLKSDSNTLWTLLLNAIVSNPVKIFEWLN